MLQSYGEYTLLANHVPHTHLELECHAQGFRYQRPLCVGWDMLVQSGLYAFIEGIYGLLSLGAGCLACDVK